MNTLTWSNSILIHLLAFTLSCKGVVLANKQPKPETGVHPSSFYKNLSSKVGILEAAAEFDDQEKSRSLPNGTSEGQGAAMLKHWAESHDTTAETSTENQTGYAFVNSTSNRSRLRGAVQAHTVMQAAFSNETMIGKEVSGNLGASITSSDKKLVASGNDLLKQWAQSQKQGHVEESEHDSVRKLQSVDISPPQPQNHKFDYSENSKQEFPSVRISDPQPQSHTNQSLAVAPAELNQSSAFVHAHDVLHDFQSEQPPRTSSQHEDEAAISSSIEEAPQSVASGSDLLAHWSEMRDKRAANDVVKTANVTATAVPTTVNSVPDTSSQPLAVSISSDVANMRASLHSWRDQRDTEDTKNSPVPERSVKEDILSLRKAAEEVPSTSNHFHEVMHNFETGPVNEASSYDGLLPRDAGVKQGVDELRQWSLSHAPSQFSDEKPIVAAVPSSPPTLFHDESRDLKTHLDSAAEFEKTISMRRQSALHDAMKIVGTDVPTSSWDDKVPYVDTVDTKSAGANVLEEWTRAHHRPEDSKFLIPSQTSEADVVRTQTYFIPSVPKDPWPRHQPVPPVTNKIGTWKTSSLHNAMRAMTSDTSVTEMQNKEQQPSLHSLQADGADTLEQWSMAHKTKRYKFMPSLPSLWKENSPSASLIRASESNSRREAPDAEIAAMRMQSEAKQWQHSDSHSFMHDIGSETNEPEASVSGQSQALSETSVGENTLEHWTNAHKAKLFPAAPRMDQSSSAQPAFEKRIERTITSPERSLPEAPDAEIAAMRMQSEAKTWQHSDSHSFMHDIGSETNELEPSVAGQSQALNDARAGESTLEHWANSHKPKVSFVPPVVDEPQKVQQKQLERIVHSPELKAASPEPLAKMWHDTAIHDAMRSIGMGALDAEEHSSALSSTRLKEAGADALERWSWAHRKQPSKRVVADSETYENLASPVARSVFANPSQQNNMMSSAAHVENNGAKNIETSLKALDRSVYHNSMQRVWKDVDESDDATPLSSKVQPQKLQAVGAGILDQWSPNRPATATKTSFMRDLESSQQASVNVAVASAPASASPHASNPIITKALIVKATQRVGGGSGEVTMESESSTAEEKGKRFLNGWSRSHFEQKHSSAIVDMYPSTPAPETDIMAMALAREANKPSVNSLQEGNSRANMLHSSLQSMVEGVDNAMMTPVSSEVHSEKPAASVGSDILSRWARAHPGSL